MIVKQDGGVGGTVPIPSARLAGRGEISARGVDNLLRLDLAIESTRRWLLAEQRPDGHWVGELEGDTILESEYVLMRAFLGQEDAPEVARCARYLLEHQNEEGGWSIYPGAPSDLSASVKAYFALKLAGHHPAQPAMARARELVRAMGGAQACNSFTRFYLALLGQIGYDACPEVPPELLFLPRRFGFSIYAMSSWTRTIVVPLSIISALKPRRELPAEKGIAELFREDLAVPSRRTPKRLTWTNFFLGVDSLLKTLHHLIPRSWRAPAIARAHDWMSAHFANSEGLGAIFPPMIYSVIAMRSLGYDLDAEPVRKALEQLDDLLIDEADTTRVQPCVSPVWDTAIATIALADSGIDPSHHALRGAERWLLAREVRSPGDWQVRCPNVQPAGWHFQYRNDFYPDVDDTAMVLLALDRTARPGDKALDAATTRGFDWVLAMQNRDGGWAAFDRDIDNIVLTKVPFADHNAMLDPSCADITARVVELMGIRGHRAEHPSIAKALDYLWATQEPEGCWYGRWGVNYIYGTWQVMLGLRAIDFPMDHPAPRRAAEWLESVQQADGGWGESCRSYDDPAWMGRGPTTPSQTAWAVAGLVAAGRANSSAVRRGVDYLIRTQNADGSWDESCFTGTGFPRVFYLRYHLYRIYFPLMALSRYRTAIAGLSRSRAVGEPLSQPIAPNPGILACGVPAQPRPFEV